MLDTRGIYPNEDFFTATIHYALGIPEEYFTSFFSAARIPEWVAYVLAQYKNHRLIHPTLNYTGGYENYFISINKQNVPPIEQTKSILSCTAPVSEPFI
jgi:citrate synthase